MHLLCSRERCMKLLVVLLSSIKVPRAMPVNGRIWLKGQLLPLPQSGQCSTDTRVIADQTDRDQLLLMLGQRSHFGQLSICLDRTKKLCWMVRTDRESCR